MVTKSQELLAAIRAANKRDPERINPNALAREAGLSPTSVYDMLAPGWENRAVANLEALAGAFERLTKRKPPKAPARQKATRGR